MDGKTKMKIERKGRRTKNGMEAGQGRRDWKGSRGEGQQMNGNVNGVKGKGEE